MEQLEILKKRLDKIGIDVEFVANFPSISKSPIQS